MLRPVSSRSLLDLPSESFDRASQSTQQLCLDLTKTELEREDFLRLLEKKLEPLGYRLMSAHFVRLGGQTAPGQPAYHVRGRRRQEPIADRTVVLPAGLPIRGPATAAYLALRLA